MTLRLQEWPGRTVHKHAGLATGTHGREYFNKSEGSYKLKTNGEGTQHGLKNMKIP